MCRLYQKVASNNKTYIVGNELTIREFVNSSKELAGSIIKLTSKRVSLNIKRIESNNLSQQIDRSSNERDRLLEAMKQYNFEGSTDTNLREDLNRSFSIEQKRAEECLNEKQKIDEELFKGQMEFVKESISEVSKLYKIFTPCIIAIRKELQLSTDEKLYERIMEAASAMQVENLEELLDEVSSLVTDQT